MKTKASLFTIPTQAAATFCADTSAVDACKLESRTAAGIAADSCFRVAGVSFTTGTRMRTSSLSRC